MDDQCPAWCVTGADHVDEMVLRLGGAYWHRSKTATVPTEDTCPGGVEVIVDVRLEQLTTTPSPTPSPTPSMGIVTGIVKICGGYYPAHPLAGATVSASQGASSREHVVTPASGVYRLGLPSGHYVLTFSSGNLTRQEPVDVTANATSTVDMELAAGCA